MEVAAGVGIANFGDRAIILDCRSNRYRQLGARQAAVLAAIDAGQEIGDQAALDSLIRAGIVDPTAAKRDVCQVPDVLHSALDATCAIASSLSTVRVAGALVDAVIRLRWTSFSAVVAYLRSLRIGAHPRMSDDELLTLARAYDQVRPRIPIRRICLRDSVALFSILMRAGGECRLVFGVRPEPFGAHCWVQADSTILSDSLESARQMRPVLVL